MPTRPQGIVPLGLFYGSCHEVARSR
jgi:hypothetical protein